MGRERRAIGTVAAVWGLAIVAAWGLAIVTAGCGDSKSERTARGTRETQVSLPPVTATPPAEQETKLVSVPVNVSFEEAESSYRDRRYDEAVDLFSVYVDRKPENAWGHYMLGLSAWKAGRYELAEEAFGDALDRDPKHVKSLINLSRVLLDVGRGEEALEKIETAIEIDSTSGDAYRLLGRTRHELGQVDEAGDAYRHAIVLDGEDAWSMNNLGLLWIQQERFEEALGPLARAVELRGDVPVFQNNLGIALERSGHIVAAAEAYRAALELDSTYGKPSVSLARVEVLKPEAEVEPVDLARLAQAFAEEIERWRLSSVTEMPPLATDSEDVGPPVVLKVPQGTPPDDQE